MIDTNIEKTVLGSMMFDTVCLETGLMMLGIECFTIDWHIRCFRAIKELVESGSTVDVFFSR